VTEAERPDVTRQGLLPAVARMLRNILLALATLALVVLGFFFLAAALAAGAILAAGILARTWWVGRKLARTRDAQYLTAEYTVVEREGSRDPRLPPGP
jgi:hypothetical protein